MFSEGHGATAGLLERGKKTKKKKTSRTEARDLGGGGEGGGGGWGGVESSANKVNRGRLSPSSIASRQLQVADHYRTFPDMAVSYAIIIPRVLGTLVWHI